MNIENAEQPDSKKKTKWLAWLSFGFAGLSVIGSIQASAGGSLTHSVIALLISVSFAISSLEKHKHGATLIKVGLAAAFFVLIGAVGM